MIAAVIALIIVIIYLLGGAIPYEGDAQNIIFSSPAFISACAALAGSVMVLCGKRGLRLKNLFYQMLHFGVVIILAGAFIGHVWGGENHVLHPGRPRHDV